jgi:hypothetical protein
MSRARMRVWQKGVRRRLSGGEVKVRLWKMQQSVAVRFETRSNTCRRQRKGWCRVLFLRTVELQV